MKNKYIIVGEEFKKLTRIDRVVSISESKNDKMRGYVLAQGLDPDAIKLLRYTKSTDDVKYSNLASPEVTHKHMKRNIIITQPQKVSNQEFLSHLVVCESNKLIIEHVIRPFTWI